MPDVAAIGSGGLTGTVALQKAKMQLCALACVGVKAAARMVKINGSCGSGERIIEDSVAAP